MPNYRLPAAVAEMTGAADKNPKRHRSRKEPKGSKPLGAPSRWMNERLRDNWADVTAEFAYLLQEDRGIVELICHLRCRLHDGEASASEIKELRMCYAELGGSPTKRSKVSAPDEPDDDPADKYLQ